MGNPRKLRRVVVKEELVALTGNYIKALILNQMIFWSERVKDSDLFLLETKRRQENLDVELQHGWIYKNAKELAEELMIDASPQTIRRYMQALIEAGYIQERHNPKYTWDRTMQYRVDLDAVTKGLREIGYYLDGYATDESSIFQNGDCIVQDGGSNIQPRQSNVQPGCAIPEITTKITEPETTTAKTNLTAVSNARACTAPKAKTVRLGSLAPAPSFDVSILEEETTQSEDLDSEPNDSANDDPNRLSAAPPAGLTPAQNMAYGMLTDPEVGVGERDALAWVRDRDSKLLDLIRHVAVWWSDRYLRKTVDGVGALESRIRRGCSPNRWPDAFNEFDLYQRHYPLARQEARERENRKRYAGFPVMGLGAGSDNQLDPDLVRLLDALPVPLWEEDPPC